MRRRARVLDCRRLRQQCLYFRPLRQGHGSLRPTLWVSRRKVATSAFCALLCTGCGFWAGGASGAGAGAGAGGCAFCALLCTGCTICWWTSDISTGGYFLGGGGVQELPMMNRAAFRRAEAEALGSLRTPSRVSKARSSRRSVWSRKSRARSYCASARDSRKKRELLRQLAMVLR
jgi:hypothetical protein